MNFGDNKIIFTQPGMDKSFFFLDENGKICIPDLDTVTLLPESFASYTMRLETIPFAGEVAEHLDWPRSPIQYSMARTGAILNMMNDRTLGIFYFFYLAWDSNEHQ
ncbi:hypothetical protein BOTBODRAFT_295108 [Botryobasidium botryosum FD-172 SS1]|uniref:Uncharacterized protein n=1 Tax=Botryobasidium botryosum (strain FD-172 SS1) TaxID=930990 RepID=A0A067LS15_BOTB1|nr:hypothetical protein BOTBODRAFT_295108 [Botryobasidium botryosum FD-172 SS1]